MQNPFDAFCDQPSWSFDSTTLRPRVPLPEPSEAPPALLDAAPSSFNHEAYGFSNISGMPFMQPPAATDGMAWGDRDTTAAAAAAAGDAEQWGCCGQGYELTTVPLAAPATDSMAWSDYDTTAAVGVAEQRGCYDEGTALNTVPLAPLATDGWAGWPEHPQHQGTPPAAGFLFAKHLLPGVAGCTDSSILCISAAVYQVVITDVTLSTQPT